MSAPSASSSSSSVVDVTSGAQLSALEAQSASSGRALVLLFTAAWHPPCAAMRTLLDTLAAQQGAEGPLFAALDSEVEGNVDAAERFAIESVPTTVILRGATKAATVQGANAQQITAAIQQHARTAAPVAAAAAAASPATAAATAEPESIEALHARLGKLVRAAPVMAFIKGTVEAPRCGFTRQLLALLKEQSISFSTFDILSDQTVREGLKTFSNWPTYPQLYIDGELVGGLDVVKELAAAGELAGMIPAGHIAASAEATAAELNTRLKELINQRRVMLFMKGSPAAPQCGFSSKAVGLLEACGLTHGDFGSFDIFTDEAVREGLKTFSNWPTYPQLYVDGELLGGLDVMQEMKENGDLEAALNAPPPLEPTKAQ